MSCLYHKNSREERKDGEEEEDKDDSKSHEATSATGVVPSHDWAKELDVSFGGCSLGVNGMGVLFEMCGKLWAWQCLTGGRGVVSL